MRDQNIRASELDCAAVRLEPLAETHRSGLRAAAADPRIWTYMPIRGDGDAFDRWFDGSLAAAAAGKEVIWAVRDPASGALVGSTRYMAIEPAHRRVEIGHTWYAPSVWGGPVNPGCKYLLLGYGFETLRLIRIELKTDARNARSQAAIAKLGARREGVLRHHYILADGYRRDSVYFSILAGEWPAAKAGLEARLAEAGMACETPGR